MCEKNSYILPNITINRLYYFIACLDIIGNIIKRLFFYQKKKLLEHKLLMEGSKMYMKSPWQYVLLYEINFVVCTEQAVLSSKIEQHAIYPQEFMASVSVCRYNQFEL